jgi:hypothetical protein
MRGKKYNSVCNEKSGNILVCQPAEGGLEAMLRITSVALISALFAMFAFGCASSKTEAQKRREAYRLAHVPKTQKSKFMSANNLINDGDTYYFEAQSTGEKKEKTRLLKKAGACYRKAITKMRDIVPQIEDPADRNFVKDVIRHTEASLEEAVRSLPMFE